MLNNTRRANEKPEPNELWFAFSSGVWSRMNPLNGDQRDQYFNKVGFRKRTSTQPTEKIPLMGTKEPNIFKKLGFGKEPQPNLRKEQPSMGTIEPNILIKLGFGKEPQPNLRKKEIRPLEGRISLLVAGLGFEPRTSGL
jgi:hypothetical protein